MVNKMTCTLHHYLLIGCLSYVGLLGCQEVPQIDATPDQVSQLLSFIQQKQWGKLKSYFTIPARIQQFPIRKAFDQQQQWHQLRRIRLMDQHLVFDIDMMDTKKQCYRYTFWTSVQDSLSSTSEQNYETSLHLKIIDWSPVQYCTDYPIKLDEIAAPTRFSATSFRGIPQVESLGVLSQSQLAEDLSLWTIEMSTFKVNQKNLKRRGCRSVKMSQLDKTLAHQIQQQCYTILKQEAERSNRMQKSKSWIAQRKVDTAYDRNWEDESLPKLNTSAHLKSRDKRLKRNKNKNNKNKIDLINLDQEIKKQSLIFNGTLDLEQNLSTDPFKREIPTVKENMLIAPLFTQCVRRTTWQWSKTNFKKAACTLEVSLLVKTYRL